MLQLVNTHHFDVCYQYAFRILPATSIDAKFVVKFYKEYEAPTSTSALVSTSVLYGALMTFCNQHPLDCIKSLLQKTLAVDETSIVTEIIDIAAVLHGFGGWRLLTGLYLERIVKSWPSLESFPFMIVSDHKTLEEFIQSNLDIVVAKYLQSGGLNAIEELQNRFQANEFVVRCFPKAYATYLMGGDQVLCIYLVYAKLRKKVFCYFGDGIS
jgi:hypothetical protein